MANRVTMSDVARQAGVSLMTVSRVINNKGDVSIETRQRILEIIASLDYRPSAIARSLATKETCTIGLVVPDITNPFFADITRGVEHLAYSRGYQVFLCNSEEDPQRELAVIQSLEEKRVDGLILCSSRLEEEKLGGVLANLPAVVLINRCLYKTNEDIFDSVILDDERGGWLATRHLIQAGHLHIGFLGGPPASFSGKGRGDGYLAALQESGLNPDEGWISNCQPSVDGGRQAALDMLAQYPQLTGLFCFNDLVAVGALHACDELGRRVPEDLAIVGHDDIPLAALVTPGLTTCRVPRYELGAMAVNALFERFQDSSGECHQGVLQAELIIRESAP
jgi:LacI family transcriptional regulator